MSAPRGTVVVTGASTGIGRATALRLAGSGFEVLAGVRKEADGEALAAQAPAGGSIEPVLVDVTDAGQVAARLRGLTPGRPVHRIE